MTDDLYHYILRPTGDEEDEEFNKRMYWLCQQPTEWAYKGIRLRRDAALFFDVSENARLRIVSELEKLDFNFHRFYRWELEDSINQILGNHPDLFLPDFNSYYLLSHLAVENILKSIWLDSNSNVIPFDKLHNLPRDLNKHDLKKICSKINFTLSENQEELLKKIHDLFIGYSRYPIKTQVTKHGLDVGEKSISEMCIDCLENPFTKDKETLDILFKQLEERLEKVFSNSHQRMLSTFKRE